MSDFDEPAFPTIYQGVEGTMVTKGGLTIRQQAVLMAMQGMLASGCQPTAEQLARDAIGYADAVLRAEMETRSG